MHILDFWIPNQLFATSNSAVDQCSSASGGPSRIHCFRVTGNANFRRFYIMSLRRLQIPRPNDHCHTSTQIPHAHPHPNFRSFSIPASKSLSQHIQQSSKIPKLVRRIEDDKVVNGIWLCSIYMSIDCLLPQKRIALANLIPDHSLIIDQDDQWLIGSAYQSLWPCHRLLSLLGLLVLITYHRNIPAKIA